MIRIKTKNGKIINKFCEIKDINRYAYQHLEDMFKNIFGVELIKNRSKSPFWPEFNGLVYSPGTMKFTDFSLEKPLTFSNPFNLVKSVLYFRDSGVILNEFAFTLKNKELNNIYTVKTRVLLEEWLSTYAAEENDNNEKNENEFKIFNS